VPPPRGLHVDVAGRRETEAICILETATAVPGELAEAIGRVAGVGRAGIGVVAGHDEIHTASSRVAGVGRAGIGVVAGHRRVNAAHERVARIHGARIGVVAIRSKAPDARARRAGIRGSASIPVIAGRGVVGVLASGGRVAGVGRADVSIITHERRVSHALAILADVASGARVRVIAGNRVVRVDTTSGRDAHVVGAKVVVVAVDEGPVADPGVAHIILGAEALVVARDSVVVVNAEPGSRIAGVVGADIGVSAVLVQAEIRRALEVHADLARAAVRSELALALAELPVAVVVLAIRDLCRAGVNQIVGVVAVRKLESRDLRLGRPCLFGLVG